MAFRIGRSIAILGMALAAAHPAAAEEWAIYGARAMGMGGAGVAAARGGQSTYWNPAALGRTYERKAITPAEGGEPKWEEQGHFYDFSMGISTVAAASGEAVQDIDTLRSDLEGMDFNAITQKIEAGTSLTDQEIQGLTLIVAQDIPALDDPGEGLVVNSAAGPALRVWRFGLTALGIVHAAAGTRVDMENVALGTQGFDPILGPGADRSGQLSPSGQSLANDMAATGGITQNQAEEMVWQAEQGGVDTSDPQARNSLLAVVDATAAAQGSSGDTSITNNQSGARLRGIFLQEIALGYGQPIGEWLSLGVAVKGMHGITYSQDVVLADLAQGKKVAKEIFDLENTEGSFNFGIDAGALFTPAEWVAIGVTGRNLNFPAFATQYGGHVVLDPNARAGVAFFPLPWLTLAADLDLFANHSAFLPGFRSQFLGAGAEVDLGVVALRLGLSKNIADMEESIVLHAGLALRLGSLCIEAAAMTTPEFTEIGSGGDSARVPERCGASLTLGLNIDF